MVVSTSLLEVLDPTAESASAEGIVADRPADLNDKRLGLLANGKRNSEELLEAVYDLLSERYHFSGVLRRNKGNASRPAPREVIDDLVRECDLVVTATGD